MNFLIDYKIPLWGIISTFIIIVVPVVWALINNHFSLKANTKEIAKIENEMYYQEKAINSLRKDLEQKLDDHKKATDEKLSSINATAIETKTLVKLLVDNKLKQ